MNDTVLLKLRTGEEILGQGEKEETGWRLNKTRRITQVPVVTPEGIQIVNVLTPFLAGEQARESFFFESEDVLFDTVADLNMDKVYLQITSGIQLLQPR
jgi:hypothetical protein